MEANFRTIQSAALADWGPAIETAVRRIAVLVAFTYALGFTFGAWVHRTNDRLAAAYVAFLGLAEPVAVVTTAEPVAEPVADPTAEPEITAAELEAFMEFAWQAEQPAACELTVVELRKLARARGIKSAGGRRIAQATKAALMEALG